VSDATRGCVVPGVWRCCCALALLLLLAGCGGSSGGGDNADRGATTAATDATQQLFADRGCAACHGARGEGDGTNPNTKLAGTRYIIGQFQQRVRNGKGSAMPGSGPDKISDDEIKTLHDWLQGLPAE
jgi:mono/diheme cytochrome c family protein